MKFKCLNFVNQQFGMSRVCNAFVSFPSHPVLKVSATGRRSGKNVRKVNIWRGSRKVWGEREPEVSALWCTANTFCSFLPRTYHIPQPKTAPYFRDRSESSCCLAMQLFVLLNALRQHVPQIQWQTDAYLLLFTLCGVYK